MPRWYVSIDSKASGPFETADVVESIRQRKYVLVDLVFQEGGTLWQSFDEVGEFKLIFDELKSSDESRSKAGSHLNHPWVVLKKVKDSGPDKYLQEGPYSSDEIISQISKGKLQYSDYAWKKTFDKWVRIGFIPEFDRMRTLDENSFIDYKVPIPELADLDDDTAKISTEDMMKSIRILKKDETFYQNPEDDPEYVAPVSEKPPEKPIIDVEVNPSITKKLSVKQPIVEKPVVVEESEKAPVERRKYKREEEEEAPAISFSEDSLKNIFNGEFQSESKTPPPESIKEDSHIGELMKKGLKLDLKKGDWSEKTQLTREESKLEEATQVIRRPELKKETPAKVEPPKQSVKASEPEKKASMFAGFGMKKAAETSEEAGLELQKEPVKEKSEDSQAGFKKRKKKKSKKPRSGYLSMLAMFAILVIVLVGLYNFRNTLFGENGAVEKLTQNIQKAIKGTSDEPVPPIRNLVPPPPPPPVQTQAQDTAAQDPNLKSKVESQLESGANQKLPETNVPPPPPQQQEPAKFGNQKASYVDVDIRNFSKNSKVVLLTNGSVGTSILVYVSARTGEILTFPSFYREYKVVRKNSKNPELDLSSLAPGKYNIEAEIGDLKRLRTLAVKEDDFNKRIEAHLKQVSYEQQKEKKALFYGSRSLETLLKKLFETAKTAPNQAKEWASFYAGFRQSTKLSLSALVTSLNDSNRNNYAYPDEIFDLIDLKDSILKTAEELDKSIKIKKAIDTKAEQDILRELEKIRKRAAILSVRKVLN